jgi:hypothetical protein
MTAETEHASHPHTYVCACCSKEGQGRYVAGGWWLFPLGWFVHDAADRWVCSAVCARSLLNGDREDGRRRSGQRAKIDPALIEAKLHGDADD